MIALTTTLRATAISLAFASAAVAQSADPAPETDATTTPEEINIDLVVATVGGTKITLGHMIATRAQLGPQYDGYPAEPLYTGILNQLIQQTALAQSFTGELPKGVALTLENERRAATAGQVVANYLPEAVTEEAVAARYQEAFASMEPPPEYNASHILVETEEEAAEIVLQLADGAEFAELAREKSTGPSGPDGGQLDWFGEGQMVPPFEAAVAELEPGEVSGPVQTQFGWHVVKLNDVRASEMPALEDVAEDIRRSLEVAEFNSFVDGLVEAATVERADTQGVDPAVLGRFELLE